MKIDSHQHFWKFNPVRDTWINDSMGIIKRDFLPQDVLPHLNEHNFDGVIAVQADQTEEETSFLLKLANENPFIKGVVGWVDLRAENVEERLNFFTQNKKLKGIRHIIQGESEDFILRQDFQNGISKLEKFNLIYDILIYPNQLENTIRLVEKFPNQIFVLNHIAKPNIKDQEIDNWQQKVTALAFYPNVNCKVSGMVTEADWQHWKYEDFVPYLDVVFKAFGTDRLLFGSDWPVSLLASSYTNTINVINKYTNSFSSDEKLKIMGENAIRIYAL